MAGWDLYGKMKRKPLFQLWELNQDKSPATDYTVGIDSLENMLLKIKNNPAPIYKIKVGTSDDLEKLIEIRKKTDSIIRIDANAGWTLEQALNILPVLEKLNIELIEQPLEKNDFEGTAKLKNLTNIPLIADESCIGISDIEKCKNVFSGINIKLTKCSGITPAFEMIKLARASNLSVMLGCMNESTIGTAALAHMAPLVDYLDADGPLLLGLDIATGLTYDNHFIKVSNNNGLGIVPDPLLFT
jgi:L-alanine-DL-glutamate epimerase-like enolase superfamily enzyme